MKKLFIIIGLVLTAQLFSQSTNYNNSTPFLRPGPGNYMLGTSWDDAGTVGFMKSTDFMPVYNILSFGAIGDDVAQNTSAIQAAIDSAHAMGGGLVYIPKGIYKTGGLTLYDDVSLKGDGYMVSQLKSISAEALITEINYGYYDKATSISDLRLHGNNIGTIGLDLQNVFNCNYRSLYIQQFTQRCVRGKGLLVGAMYNVIMQQAPVIMELTVALPPTSQWYDASNLMTFVSCTWGYGSQWGIIFNSAANLNLFGCDISYNGTLNNNDTGGILVTNASPGNEMGTLNLFGGWCESGKGTTIRIDNPLGNSRCNIYGFPFILELGTNPVTIDVIGTAANAKINEVVIYGTNVPTIKADGSFAKIKCVASVVGDTILTNGATLSSAVFE